jgi:hypothetical protein
MDVCDQMSSKPCGVSGCDPVFADGKSMLVRRDDGIPKRMCWTDDLAAWLSDPAIPHPRRSFVDVSAEDASSVLLAFVQAHPKHIPNLEFVGSPGTVDFELRACRFVFESTFVEPKSLSVTKDVVKRWDEAVKQIVKSQAPAMDTAFSTGGYALPHLISQ